MMLEKRTATCKRMKLVISLLLFTATQNGLNVKYEAIKLQEENIGGKLLDVGLDNDFLFGYETKNIMTNAKINKLGLCQTKKLLHSKRKQLTRWKGNQ